MTDWDDETRWPAWVREPVVLAPSDPGWQQAGVVEAARLTSLCGPDAVGSVHHIGSTAVPGLPAKPILDFAVASRSRHRTAEHLADALTAAPGEDWVLVPDGLHPLPIRLLVRVVDGRRHTHLQVVDQDDPHLARLLAFRDALRADPRARDTYARAKQASAEAHADDRSSYTDGKAAVIAETLRSVGVEPA